MEKFLNYNGLSTFWDKIKNYVDDHSGTSNYEVTSTGNIGADEHGPKIDWTFEENPLCLGYLKKYFNTSSETNEISNILIKYDRNATTPNEKYKELAYIWPTIKSNADETPDTNSINIPTLTPKSFNISQSTANFLDTTYSKINISNVTDNNYYRRLLYVERDKIDALEYPNSSTAPYMKSGDLTLAAYTLQGSNGYVYTFKKPYINSSDSHTIIVDEGKAEVNGIPTLVHKTISSDDQRWSNQYTKFRSIGSVYHVNSTDLNLLATQKLYALNSNCTYNTQVFIKTWGCDVTGDYVKENRQINNQEVIKYTGGYFTSQLDVSFSITINNLDSIRTNNKSTHCIDFGRFQYDNSGLDEYTSKTYSFNPTYAEVANNHRGRFWTEGCKIFPTGGQCVAIKGISDGTTVYIPCTVRVCLSTNTNNLPASTNSGDKTAGSLYACIDVWDSSITSVTLHGSITINIVSPDLAGYECL